MYQVTRLQNGLTVVTGEMPYMTSVSLGLWVGVGGRSRWWLRGISGTRVSGVAESFWGRTGAGLRLDGDGAYEYGPRERCC